MAYVSPRITFSEWQSGLKNDLDVFEDQIKGFVFEQARALVRPDHRFRDHAGPAILMLVTPYIEAIASYLNGRESKKRESSAFIIQGLKAVVPYLKDDAARVYVSQVRNGFAHEAVFRRVVIHHGDPAQPSFGMRADRILAIDPWWLLDKAEAHFFEYVTVLRSGSDLEKLENFGSFMQVRKMR